MENCFLFIFFNPIIYVNNNLEMIVSDHYLKDPILVIISLVFY